MSGCYVGPLCQFKIDPFFFALSFVGPVCKPLIVIGSYRGSWSVS